MTLEEMWEKDKQETYGACHKCNVQFKYDDDFFETTKYSCGQSQGYPECFKIGESVRLCVKCFIVNN